MKLNVSRFFLERRIHVPDVKKKKKKKCKKLRGLNQSLDNFEQQNFPSWKIFDLKGKEEERLENSFKYRKKKKNIEEASKLNQSNFPSWKIFDLKENTCDNSASRMIEGTIR